MSMGHISEKLIYGKDLEEKSFSLRYDLYIWAEDLPEKNNPYHPCVSESLPRDAAHNQKVSDYWLLQFLQYCK